MATLTNPTPLVLDEDLCQLIARDIAAHHHRAERRHVAETGSTDPLDEEREAVSEVERLLKLARPELDGDELAAIDRLKVALEREIAHH